VHEAASLLDRLNERNERIGAVILAGGLARRMGGQDKGLVELGKRPMASWVLSVVTPHVHDVVINANRHESEYRQLGCRVVADRHEGHLGPLAGLSAAIHELDTNYVLMCPCDSPFVDALIVDRLGSAIIQDNVEIAVASDGQRMQPVFSVVRKQVIASLDAFLDAGERKIDRWYATHNTVEVNCSDLTASFRNINTEEERLEAEQELLAST